MVSTSGLKLCLLIASAAVLSWGCSDSKDGAADATTTNPMSATGTDAGVGAGIDATRPAKIPYTIVYDDPLFKETFVDIDEWRDTPVRHRYIHGGFVGTDARFSIYFPPEDKYQGRFFHYILPVPGNENAITNPEYADPSYTIGFAVDSGAYLVETNMGALGFSPTADPDISLWRASAAAAEHSRLLANQYYPAFGPHRPYGYAWGGSGGAFKTIACIESTDGVWDGVVPFIHASPVAMPNNFTVQANSMRLLRDKVPGIVDAVDPGGSGDMYAGLDAEQKKALEEVTKFGFPPDSWFNYTSIAFGYTGVLAALLPAVLILDPSYFQDFWKVPGYEGADAPESLAKYRLDNKTTISEIITAETLRAMGQPLSLSAAQPSSAKLPGAFKLTALPPGDLQGATITVTSGSSMGAEVQVAGVFGDLVVIGYGQDVSKLGSIQPGDEIHIDNSVYLAIQSYHRHTVPGAEYKVYDQYRDATGKPLLPQRENQTSTLVNQAGMMSGKFKGKMIVVESLMDEIAFAWHADWYRTRVKAALGASFDDQYRLWYVEKGMHTPPALTATGSLKPAINTRIINYGPVLQQALRDLAAWVEKGTPPPGSTNYEVSDGQVRVPATASERGGVQPVVVAKANGNVRADVAVGEAVHFTAVIEVPPNTGFVVGAEWDFEGRGDFPVAQPLANTTSSRVEVETTYTFSAPGTYFPAIRVSSHREGKTDTPYARLPNLGRVRVVVK